MEEQKHKDEKSFIKEKIKNKPINKRRLVCKILWVLFSGVLFGLIACLTFIVAKPKLEKLIEPQPNHMVTFPRDDESDGEGEQEDSEKNDPGENDPEGDDPIGDDPIGGDPVEGDPVEGDPVEGDPVEGDPGVDDPVEPNIIYELINKDGYQRLLSEIYAIGKKANQSVVTVTRVTSNIDWFESAYERETQSSGIIIYQTDLELLILTEKKAVSGAEELDVTFISGDVVPAVIKKYDSNTGIAVISVAMEDIPEEMRDKFTVAELGNSYRINQGTVVIAIGSPMGYNYSILPGTITSSGKMVSVWDSDYTVFSTDIMGSTSGSGVLIHLDGQVVGLVMQDFSSKGDRNILTALSISQLKGIIENLSNGKAIPYLGLKVSTVTDDISKDYGLPKGVYVKGVETDFESPAMSAGFQEGDVITSINGEEIMTVDAYTKMLHSLSPEQTVKIKVLRQSGAEHVEMEFTATVGVLP